MIAAVQFHSLVCHTPVTHWEPVPGLGAKARDSSLAASTGTSGSVSDLRRQPGTQSNLKGILCSYSIVLSATYQQLFSEIISYKKFTPYSPFPYPLLLLFFEEVSTSSQQ